MSESLETRKQKQQFLKESIIDQGISAKHFEEFLYTLKEEPYDVDSWTAGELIKVVEMFKQFENQSKINELFVSTTLLTPNNKLECEPIEYIEVLRLVKK